MAKISATLSSKVDERGKSEILLRFVGGKDYIFRLHSGIWVAPGRWKDGAVVIAFYHHVSEFGRFGKTEVTPFEADGLPERYELRRWRIDQVFSNAFTAWSRLGSPAQPTVWEREQISRHARIEEARDAVIGGGTFSGEVVLTPNSVELFEFKPV